MFTRVLIRDFIHPGEISVDLPNTNGWVNLEGASGAGKSSLMAGVAFALLGVDSDGSPFSVDGIAAGASVATVEVTTKNGTILRRSKDHDGVTRRTMIRPEGEQSFPTEEALSASLGPLVSRPEVTKLVLLPMYWRALLDKHLGRPLRDVLLSLLPEANLRATIDKLMEGQMRPSDPTEEKPALALQKQANEAAAAAKGARDAIAAQHRTAPSAADVEAARALLSLAESWALYDTSLASANAMKARYDDAVLRKADWTQRHAALGACPAAPPASELAELQGRKSKGATLIADLERQITLHASRAADREARKDGICPTCKQPLPKPQDENDRLRDGTLPDDPTADAVSMEHRAKLDAQLLRAREVMADVDQRITAHHVASAEARAWTQSVAALGPEPTIPVAPTMPTTPAKDRPSVEAVAKARETLAAVAVAARVAADLEVRKAQADTAEKEAARVKALVAAVRQAPSILAREQAAALGDTGPVSFRFPPKETRDSPEIEVLYRGRPVHRASGGEVVLVDLWIRAVVRRLAKLDALPICVDHAQNWSDAWPPIPGPVWRLWTSEGPLSVEAV